VPSLVKLQFPDAEEIFEENDDEFKLELPASISIINVSHKKAEIEIYGSMDTKDPTKFNSEVEVSKR
jgi:hypothetical protein